MARHDARSYFLHRPLYPEALFRRVIEALRGMKRAGPDVREISLADLGCGTGQSVRSWLSALEAAGRPPVVVDALDADPAMIERARAADWDGVRIRWQVASAERTGLASETMDFVSVLSAYHWLDRRVADDELVRLLRPGGLLLIAEYQFPTAPALLELNEWIRRNFNQRWKFEEQKPRGSLRELVSGLVSHPLLEGVRIERVPMHLRLDRDEVAGLLLSQARVISWLGREAGADSTRVSELEAEVHEGVRLRMPVEGAEFDFRLSAFSARKRAAASTAVP